MEIKKNHIYVNGSGISELGVMMEKWSLLPSDMTMQINKE